MLLSYYKEKNSVKKWTDEFSSNAKKYSMYAYKGTNARNILSIEKIFLKFQEVEGIERSKWPKVESSGQEEHKQYSAIMVATKLFYRENAIFYKTEKGKVFQKFLNCEFSEEEHWLINYLFLCDSFIQNVDNYLIYRTTKITNDLLKVIDIDYILSSTNEFISNWDKIQTFENLLTYDYFYINSFFRDSDFLKIYNKSSVEDKDELSKFIFNNYQNNSYLCCISKKFKPGGNYNVNMIKDDVKVFKISNMVSQIKYTSYEEVVKTIINLYNQMFEIDVYKVKKFLLDTSNIFDPIINNIYKVLSKEELIDDELLNPEETSEFTKQNLIDIPEKRIDDTSILGQKKVNELFRYRKKIAREVADFKCELEGYKDCRYFTSKNTMKNYIEIHHFIPREFRNFFEYNIDVLANYVSLCPHCHKLIHNAVDRERVDMIRYIYNQRIDRLNSVGLHIEFKNLLEFYKISNE